MAEPTAAVATTVTCTCGKQRNTYHRASLVDSFICLPLQRIVPVIQTAGVLDSNVLRDAVPVCAAGGCDGSSCSCGDDCRCGNGCCEMATCKKML